MDGPFLRHRCLNKHSDIHRCLVSNFSCLCNLPCVIIDRRLFVCKTSERLTLIPITWVTCQVAVVMKSHNRLQSQRTVQHDHISSTPEVDFCVFYILSVLHSDVIFTNVDPRRSNFYLGSG